MPYICLTQSGIPDGTLQILDLVPNASLRHPGYDPPAQTRYVNRLQNDDVLLIDGMNIGDAYGLQAYLLDRIEPGGTQAGEATLTVVGAGSPVVAGDTFTIGGVVFTCVAGAATAANQEFVSWATAGSDAAMIASIKAAIDDTASQALLVTAGSGVNTANGANANELDLTADVSGNGGALSLESSSSNITFDHGHLTRTCETINARAIGNIADDIITRMDAGSSLTVSDVNAAINNAAGVSGCSLTSTGSLASLTDILSILAGRGFLLPDMSQIASDYTWHSTAVGSFSIATLVSDTQMVNGEWRPVNVGGDVAHTPVKGVTNTYHSSALEASLMDGALSKFGAGVTLWPDSDLVPQFPWQYQKGTTYSETTSRVVVVYDDDGSVLV